MRLDQELTAHPIPPVVAFSREEYASRLQRTREAMTSRGVDVLLVTELADICYLTGFNTFAPYIFSCLIIPTQGELVLQTGEIEVPSTLVHSIVREIEAYPWWEGNLAGASLAGILERRGLARGRVGVEFNGRLSYAHFERLRAALSSATLVDTSGLIFDQRVVKSPAEIEYMRKAAAISGEGIRGARAALATAKYDNDIAAASIRAMVAAGSEYFWMQPIFTVGVRTGGVHLNYERIPVGPGDPVFMEVAGVYGRYTAPVMRTSMLGEPSMELLALAENCNVAFDLLMREIRPGRTGHEVNAAMLTALKDVPDPGAYDHKYFAYSVGLGWGDGDMYIAEGIERPLLPGMTFHTARANRYPGRIGVGLSETIVVTETGAEVLDTGVDRALHVFGT